MLVIDRFKSPVVTEVGGLEPITWNFLGEWLSYLAIGNEAWEKVSFFS